MISKIVLKLKDKEIELSLEESQQLYNELHKLFGKEYISYPAYPINPIQPAYPFWLPYTTCDTKIISLS